MSVSGSSSPNNLARALARQAEAVCRHYLPHGRRCGNYWLVGDVYDTPGRSLYVRLRGPETGPGAAGKWTDAASGEHGDLLDLIAFNQDLHSFRKVRDEVRRFLCLPTSEPPPPFRVPRDGPEAARRLFARGRSLRGSQAEAYLRARRIIGRLDWPSLRSHPALWYRADENAPRQSWPGLLAAITDPHGLITGVHRIWLDREQPDKAPLLDPKRTLGDQLGHGVRFGVARHVVVAGEGLETMLSLKGVLPGLPMVAALSANHLAALAFTPGLSRLYVSRDNDPAGRRAAAQLHARGHAAGIEVRDLVPVGGDFNDDLCRLGSEALRAHVVAQLAPGDAVNGVAVHELAVPV
jgi:hypothetical protein